MDQTNAVLFPELLIADAVGTIFSSHHRFGAAASEDIQDKLNFRKKNILKTSFERKNLVYLVRNVENKKNYLLYRDKTEAARIMDQKDSTRVANVAVASRANKPTIPIFPKKILMGFLSIIVGLITGLGCAFAAYYLDHTVKRPEDIFQNCKVPVLSDLGIVKQL